MTIPAAAGNVSDASGEGVLVAQLPATETAIFDQVALSWEAGGSTDLTAQIRLRKNDTWQSWQTLEIVESDKGRVGTDIPFVDDSNGIEVRLLGKLGANVSDVTATLINSQILPVTNSAEPKVSLSREDIFPKGASGGAGIIIPRPNIITREQWGANSAYWNVKNVDGCASPLESIKGAVVHHTAGANGYTANESAGIVRGIYYYHAVQLGWCDIGYNFLVDQYGQIFQGRVGDLDRAMWGAHATYVNDESVGVSFLGNTQEIQPSEAAINSISSVIAWRFSQYGINPYGMATYINSSGARDEQPAITGHGLLKYHNTTCPGTYLKNRLPDIRAKVAALMKPSANSVVEFDQPGVSAMFGRIRLSGRVAPFVVGQSVFVDGRVGGVLVSLGK
ncbi:MAG: N-acetylmuramoyl-L-alanine amidase, partial [Propionibacteriaceae bacterium]